MSLGRRLINTGAAAEAATCLTDDVNPFTGEVADGGVALYNLDYDASDASGSYDGTPTDVTFGVGGKINYGARFNGTSSYISTSINTHNISTITYSFWAYWKSDIEGFVIGGTGNDGATGKKSNRQCTSLNGANSRFDYLTRQGDYCRHTTSLSEGWHHFAVVDNNSTDALAMKMYVDGSSVSFSTPVTANYSTNTALQIGRTRKNDGTIGNFFNSDLDQVRIFDEALTSDEVYDLYQETACVYTSTTDIVNFPNLKTNKAYIPFDNSAEDLVSGDFGTIASGMDFKFGRYGQAIRTTANAHFVNFPNISESPNSPFSYSCWANITDINQRVYLFFWATASGATSAWGGILNGGGGKPYFNFCSNAATASTFTVPQNQWFHYVATYDGTTAKAYVDNQLVLTANISTNSLGTNNLRILDTITDTEAMIDQIRVYDSALDTDDIDKLYNEKQDYITKDASDPFGDSSSVALYEMENNADDTSGNGNNGAESNVTFSTTDPIRGTYEATFNGSSSKITLPSGFLDSATTLSFSIWVKPSSFVNFTGILDKYVGSTSGWTLDVPSSTNRLPRITIYDGANKTVTGTTALTLGNWTHIVGTISTSEMKIYVNGSLEGTTSITTLTTNTTPLVIGGDGVSTLAFNGDIDQVRIFNKALDGTEAYQLYAEGARVTGL